MGVDFRELEHEICRIPEISAARIVVNEDGLPIEVHILAAPTKLAKQVVRDVQSVALAAFGVELDRRTISVVQLEGSTLRLAPAPEGEEGDGGDIADEPVVVEELLVRSEPAREEAPPPVAVVHNEASSQARPRLVSVQTERTARRARAEVTLSGGSGGPAQATGSAEGLYSEAAALRLVCLATLSALRQLDPQAERTDLESAAVVTLGMRHVALVGIVLVEGPVEELCTGSALVRVTGPFDALARATLDAVNRRLTRPV